MKDIFISHSSADKITLVNALADVLVSNGLDVWLDSKEMTPGSIIPEQIKIGISESLCCLLVVTSSFLKSHWTFFEIGFFSANKNKTIIPIFLDVTDEERLSIQNIIGNRLYLVLNSSTDVTKIIPSIMTCVRQAKSLLGSKGKMKSLVELSRDLHNVNSAVAAAISQRLTNWHTIASSMPTVSIPYAREIVRLCFSEMYMDYNVDAESKIFNKDFIDGLSKISDSCDREVIKHAKLILDAQDDPICEDPKTKIDIIDYSLHIIMNWYYEYHKAKFRIKSSADFTVIHPEELTEDDFLEFYEIDKLVLRNDLIATPDITYAWYRHNKFSHIAIKEDISQKAVGYYAAFPVNDELYNEILSGNFKDNTLETKGILQYTLPEIYKLYISTIAIHPDCQSPAAFSTLYHAIINMYLELADRQIFISDIITEASTSSGENLCELIGLKKLFTTNLNTALYAGTLLPPSLKLSYLPGRKLLNIYKNKFAELQELFPIE